MDKMEITGIKCYGYTGYLPEEQILGQWFEIDVIIWTDLLIAGKSDDIKDTTDYRHIINIVKNLVKNTKFALIERLIEAIAQEILKLDRVEKVQVRLCKSHPPIPDFGGKITLDITRSN
jgi:7,8-dihydroneopterin aldolase/epimerase/oxygenase